MAAVEFPGSWIGGGPVLVGFSGGLDSAVLVASLLKEGFEVVAGFVDDGSLPRNKKTLACALAADFGVPFRIFQVPSLADWAEDQSSYIPGLKAVSLLCLLSLAERLEISSVLLGNTKGDSCQEILPQIKALDHQVLDSHPEGIREIERLYEFLYGAGLKVVLPFASMRKSEVVTLGQSLGVPFDSTCSCPEKTIRYLHCGVCPTCLFRRAAFDEAKISDPAKYESEF